MKEISNCDELLQLLVDNYDQPLHETIKFEGFECSATGCYNDLKTSTLIISPKYDRTLFIIGRACEVTGNFMITILRNAGEVDELPGIILPNYVRKELIATAKGKW